MWMEEHIGKRVNHERVEEALDTGASKIATGCPFCRVMITDGVDDVAAANDVPKAEVLDVAQLLLGSLDTSSVTLPEKGTAAKESEERAARVEASTATVEEAKPRRGGRAGSRRNAPGGSAAEAEAPAPTTETKPVTGLGIAGGAKRPGAKKAASRGDRQARGDSRKARSGCAAAKGGLGIAAGAKRPGAKKTATAAEAPAANRPRRKRLPRRRLPSPNPRSRVWASPRVRGVPAPRRQRRPGSGRRAGADRSRARVDCRRAEVDRGRARSQGPRHRPRRPPSGCEKARGACAIRARGTCAARARSTGSPSPSPEPSRRPTATVRPLRHRSRVWASRRVHAHRANGNLFAKSLDSSETMVDVTTHHVPFHATGHHPRQRTFTQSSKLQDVLYEIRGPVHEHATRLEAEGHRILKLNIGNPAPFGFEAPDVIMRDIIQALPNAQGYSDSKGIMPARRAVFTRYELVDGFPKFDVDDVYLGNGVSELITMTLQALLDNGDQVLIPAPDYPLWTASTSLAGGTPVHYLCDETQGWKPDIADLEIKITDRTKAIVVINPNNPTGAVYTREILDADGRSRAQASAAAARRRDLRQDPLRRRRAHRDGFGRPRRADAHLQRAVEGLPGRRLPVRLAGHHRPQGARGQLHRGHQPAGQHAAVPECACAACHSGRAGRPSKHRRPGPARRPAARTARRRLERRSTKSPECHA